MVLLASVAGLATAGGIAAGGMLIGFAGESFAFVAQLLYNVSITHARIRFRTSDGQLRSLKRGEVLMATRIEPADDEVGSRLQTQTGVKVSGHGEWSEGEDARRALAAIIPCYNIMGGRKRTVEAAVSEIESLGRPKRFLLDPVARGEDYTRNGVSGCVSEMPKPTRWVDGHRTSLASQHAAGVADTPLPDATSVLRTSRYAALGLGADGLGFIPHSSELSEFNLVSGVAIAFARTIECPLFIGTPLKGRCMRHITFAVCSLGVFALTAWTAQDEYTNPVSCRYAGGTWVYVAETSEYVCAQRLSSNFRTQLLQSIADMTLDASAPEYCQDIMDHLTDELAAQVRGGAVMGFYTSGTTGGFHNPRYDRNRSSMHYSFNRRDWHTFGPISMFHEAAHHEGYEHRGNPGTYTVTEECLNL